MMKFSQWKIGTNYSWKKVRSEMEGRARLDRGMDEISESRKQIEDLKYMLSEKSR